MKKIIITAIIILLIIGVYFFTREKPEPVVGSVTAQTATEVLDELVSEGKVSRASSNSQEKVLERIRQEMRGDYGNLRRATTFTVSSNQDAKEEFEKYYIQNAVVGLEPRIDSKYISDKEQKQVIADIMYDLLTIDEVILYQKKYDNKYDSYKIIREKAREKGYLVEELKVNR